MINTDNELKQAIIYMFIASFLFAITGAFAKVLSQSMSSVEVVFFRNVTGLIIILISVYKLPLKQTGGKAFLLFFRGFIGFMALLMYFYNIATIPLAEAQTFAKTSPIFTAIFAYIFIKEKLTLRSWGGVIIGFIGILFITGFDITSLDKSDWLGILSGVGAGLAYTSIRELKNHYDTRAIVLSFMTIGTVGPIIIMIFGNYYQSDTFDFILAPFTIPTSQDIIFILGLGLFATASQLYMTKAYSLAKGGIVGTIGYSNIIFSIFLGLFLGDTFPTIVVLFGISLIILSGIIVSYNGKIK
ncbi:MAG: DMT family transporter [Arcobacteraceae bacterium]|nr:DMT family transporter [Arcobacteraceae bacterium]